MMTTTLRARFDGKVLIPVGIVSLPTGKEIELQVTAVESQPTSSAAAVLEALNSLPPISKEDADELMRLIEESKLPAKDVDPFGEA